MADYDEGVEIPSAASATSADSKPPANQRSVTDYDKGDNTAPVFVDHFSLGVPSSTVKFRGARVHVYDNSNEQFLLEDSRHRNDQVDDDDDNGKSRPRRQHRHTITVKRMEYSSFGLRLLRLWYTLVSILLAGFIFVLCFQIILFLFMNLPIEAGVTSVESEFDGVTIFGVLLSIPVFCFGLASLMAAASTFVGDSWSGGTLFRAVFALDSTLTEIIYFILFILVPVMTFLIAAMAQHNSPWEQACYAWVPCIAIVFCCFALAIVCREVEGCLKLIWIHWGIQGGLLKEIGHTILLTHTQLYSGHKKEQYLVAGDEFPPEGGYSSSSKHEPESTFRGLYCRLTELSCLSFMYETLEAPKRLYNIDEVRDVMPFVTKHSWSLEAMFCSSDSDRKIVSAKGPSSLTQRQITASIVCNIIGTILMFLVIIGLLVWIDSAKTVFVIVATLLFVLCCLYPMLRSNRSQFNMYTYINEDNIDNAKNDKQEVPVTDENMDEEALENEKEDAVETDKDSGQNNMDDVTMFRVCETIRMTQPKPWVSSVLVVLEIVFFFLWPMITLFVNENARVGFVFVIVGLFSFARRFFNVSTILSELGSMNAIEIEKEIDTISLPKTLLSAHEGADKTLVLKSRLSSIVGHISSSKSVTRWMWFFGFLFVAVFGLVLGAVGSGDGLGERPPIVLVDKFYWPGEDSLQYPTCALRKSFSFNIGDGIDHDTYLIDYAMLSGLAYETTNVTEYLLPKWFNGEAKDQDAFVDKYRTDSGTYETPTYFKLFTFPAVPDLGIVSIRGSQTLMDWATNLQLWSAAGLVQTVKWLIPYGWIWTPVMDELVSVVSWIQGSALKKVSYYTATSGFVNDIVKNNYTNQYLNETPSMLYVTGASLGGGLAIITGAQTGAPAVAISGLGADLSRNTFNPPVTKEDIDERVFNFIPDRDYIARIGGRPRQHQEAQCTAPNGQLFACHSMWRSICEIAYRCGTGEKGVALRPIPCRCVYDFGYDVPKPVDGNVTQTFEQACESEEMAFLAATGSTKKSDFPYN